MDTSNWVSPERKHFICVLFLVLFCRTPSAAAALEKTSSLLQEVTINQTLLTWSSAAEDVKFSVEYRKQSSNSEWTPIQSCRETNLTSCDVRLKQNQEENGCLRVRVAARRNGGKQWKPVEACSREGHPCSPNVSLTVSPGSLTVNLKRQRHLDYTHGDNLKHRITFWKKGEEPEDPEVELASRTFDDLETGQQYCVHVQYVLYGDTAVGPPSCDQCETIPDSAPDPTGSKTTQIIVVSVVVFGILLLVVGFAYVRLFKSKKIKELLQPPYTIPAFFQDLPPTRDRPYLAVSPAEERYDLVSSLTPKQP